MPNGFETIDHSFKTATSRSNDKGYLVILAAVLINLGSAWHLVFGNYLSYMASSITAKNIDPNNNDIGYIESRYSYYIDEISWAYSIWAICHSLSIPVGGKIEYKYGPRIAIFIGSILILGGLCSNYFVFEHSENPYYLYFSYGVLLGCGAGTMYTTPYLVGMRWYEHSNSKGLVTGIIISGMSWSSMMFNLLCTQFVNPHNIEIDQRIGFVKEESVLNNVSTSFLQFAIICFCLFSFGTIFIQNPPSYDHLHKVSFHEKSSDQTSLIKHSGDDQLSLKTILSQQKFWNLFFTLLMLPMSYVYSQWKELNNRYLGIENDQILSIMASASGVCTGVSRLFWGYLFDYLSAKQKNAYKIMMSCIAVCSVLFIASWTQLKHIGNENILIVCAFVWLIVLYLILSGALTLLPLHIAHLYGTGRGGIVYGLTNCARVGSTLFSMAAVTQLRESLGWEMMNNFWVCTQIILFILILPSKS